MHEPLKNRTYLRKKLIFNFLSPDFLAKKKIFLIFSDFCKKQPVLGPGVRKGRER